MRTRTSGVVILNNNRQQWRVSLATTPTESDGVSENIICEERTAKGPSEVSRLILESFGQVKQAAWLDLLLIRKSMTKRIGFVLEKIADMDNLREADRQAQIGGKANRCREIRLHNVNAEKDIEELNKMILTLTFPAHRYKKMRRVSDKGKVRDIINEAYFPWKILGHAIYQIIGPIMERSFITDTSCCIKGKGVFFGVRRVKKFTRLHKAMKWSVKNDCKKYYQSVSHEYFIKAIEHKFKDKRLIKLIEISALDIDCGEEIRKELEDERNRTTNWRIREQSVRKYKS